MAWLKWENGRQQSDYSKFLIAKSFLPLPFDLYILRFPEGSRIKAHVDKVDWGRHFRLNIVVKPAIEGGEFRVVKNKYTFINSKYVKFFRPDLVIHEVSEVHIGTRYVLSFGFVIPRVKEIVQKVRNLF
jgi:hypothetical protein